MSPPLLRRKSAEPAQVRRSAGRHVHAGRIPEPQGVRTAHRTHRSSPDALDAVLRQWRPLLPHQFILLPVAPEEPGGDWASTTRSAARWESSRSIPKASRRSVTTSSQEFKPHWDYFEPGTREFLRFCGTRGNRTWSFMVYLNEGMEGGGTRFTELDHTFKPTLGMARVVEQPQPGRHAQQGDHALRRAGRPPATRSSSPSGFACIGDGPVFYE